MILHFFLANRIIHEHGLHWTGIWSYKKRTISGRVLGNVKLANEWRFTTKATYLVIPELVNLTLWDRIALRYSFVVTFAASTGEGLELACKKYTTISQEQQTSCGYDRGRYSDSPYDSVWTCLNDLTFLFCQQNYLRSGCRIVYIELAFDHIRNGLFRGGF
jgi:hypothetical protein